MSWTSQTKTTMVFWTRTFLCGWGEQHFLISGSYTDESHRVIMPRGSLLGTTLWQSITVSFIWKLKFTQDITWELILGLSYFIHSFRVLKLVGFYLSHVMVTVRKSSDICSLKTSSDMASVLFRRCLLTGFVIQANRFYRLGVAFSWSWAECRRNRGVFFLNMHYVPMQIIEKAWQSKEQLRFVLKVHFCKVCFLIHLILKYGSKLFTVNVRGFRFISYYR